MSTRVTAKITKVVLVKASSIFHKAFVEYEIMTDPMQKAVRRRYKQFEWLNASLQSRFAVNYVEIG